MTGEIEPLGLWPTDQVRLDGRQGTVTQVTADGRVKIAWDGDDFTSVYSGEALRLLVGATVKQKHGLHYSEPVVNQPPRSRRRRI